MKGLKCENHAKTESLSECGMCGGHFCGQCLVSIDEKTYCKNCLTERIGLGRPAGMAKKVDTVAGDAVAGGDKTALAGVTEIDRKSRVWTFILSLIPGVGYLYLGLMKKGLQTMILFFGSVFVAGFIGFAEIMSLIVPVVIFYSIFDAQQLAKNINSGKPVEDEPFLDIKAFSFSQKWIGYALIVAGLLALMNNLPFFFPFWPTFRRMLPPILIIGLGVLILYRNTRSES